MVAALSVVHILLGSDVQTIEVEVESGMWVKKPNPDAPRIPHDNVSAVRRVVDDLGEAEVERFKKLISIPEEEIDYDLYWKLSDFGHLGLGMSIRNTFGLWDDSRLARFYTWRGKFDPDGKSGVILDGLRDSVNGIEPSNLYAARITILAVFYALLTVTTRVVVFVAGVAARIFRKHSNKPVQETPDSAQL